MKMNSWFIGVSVTLVAFVSGYSVSNMLKVNDDEVVKNQLAAAMIKYELRNFKYDEVVKNQLALRNLDMDMDMNRDLERV